MPDWRAAEARQVLSSLGSFAMLAAMRRASSRVRRCAAARRPGSSSQ